MASTDPTLTMAVPPPPRATLVEERFAAAGSAGGNVELGYESKLTPAVRRPHLLAVFTALGTGLMLLILALSSQLHMLDMTSRPEVSRNSMVETITVMVMFFGAICTLVGLIFLGIGLKWLAATRS